MSISHSEVERVARLARLRIDPADLDDRARDLGRILELFDRLAAVDTRDVEPLSHPLDATQRLRPDTVTEEVDRAALQRGAPEVEDGMYVVPRVIEPR